MLGSFARALVVPSKTTVQSVRYCYPGYYRLLVTKPRRHVAKAELAFWATFLFFGILTVPAWILYHLDEYKGKPKRWHLGHPPFSKGE